MSDTSDNPYVALMQSDEDQHRQQMLATVSGALDVDPDEFARRKRIAGWLGYPVAAVDATPEQSEREAKLKRVDIDTANAPVLRRMYSQDDFSRLAHDDSGILSQIESGIAASTRWVMGANSGGTSLPRAVQTGVNIAASGASGAFRAAFELIAPVLDPLEDVTSIGGNPLRRLAEGFAMKASSPAFKVAPITRQISLVEAGVNSGVESFVGNALALPLALAPGGQPAALKW